MIKAYILARLAEASTWRGLILFITGLGGLTLSGDQLNASVTVALALVGAIGVFFPDVRAPRPAAVAPAAVAAPAAAPAVAAGGAATKQPATADSGSVAVASPPLPAELERGDDVFDFDTLQYRPREDRL